MNASQSLNPTQKLEMLDIIGYANFGPLNIIFPQMMLITKFLTGSLSFGIGLFLRP